MFVKKFFKKRTVRLLINKYTITITVAGILYFFDKNNIFIQRELRQKLSKLQSECDYYRSETEKNKAEIEALKNNKESLERFAREKYLMKKDNEDVFVIVPDSAKAHMN